MQDAFRKKYRKNSKSKEYKVMVRRPFELKTIANTILLIAFAPYEQQKLEESIHLRSEPITSKSALPRFAAGHRDQS